MTTHEPGDADPMGERHRPGVRSQDRAVAATEAEPATTPGLVVTEDRLADARAITYFGTAR